MISSFNSVAREIEIYHQNKNFSLLFNSNFKYLILGNKDKGSAFSALSMDVIRYIVHIYNIHSTIIPGACLQTSQIRLSAIAKFEDERSQRQSSDEALQFFRSALNTTHRFPVQNSSSSSSSDDSGWD